MDFTSVDTYKHLWHITHLKNVNIWKHCHNKEIYTSVVSLILYTHPLYMLYIITMHIALMWWSAHIQCKAVSYYITHLYFVIKDYFLILHDACDTWFYHGMEHKGKNIEVSYFNTGYVTILRNSPHKVFFVIKNDTVSYTYPKVSDDSSLFPKWLCITIF